MHVNVSTPAYEALESRFMLVIKQYHKDLLVIDRDTLARFPEVPFFFAVRESGTYLKLFRLWEEEPITKRQFLENALSWKDYYKNRYAISPDGVKVIEVNADEAEAFIIEQVNKLYPNG